MEGIEAILPGDLSALVRDEKVLVVDARTFCEYNTCHIFNAINVWCSKLRKKRLLQNANSVFDYLQQACQISLQDGAAPNEVVVYDQNSQDVASIAHDSFVHVLLLKLKTPFKKVFLLSGGFLQFQTLFPELCEDSTQKISPLTSLSQPCMPVAKSGFTRILPFLFLGSQYDANNKQMLMEHNIMYELNVSTSCAKPDFLQDSHFLRIPVNDSFSEKLLPYFGEAFRFIDKVREAGGRVLVHCLAGISRSPTVAIGYVMKHLRLHFDEAYRYVKKRRPTISPNINFVGQLLELDKQLLGESSLYRSPTTPLYLEYDLSSSSSDLQPAPESLILKSSSSSCLEDNKKENPFSPQRSLPALKLHESATCVDPAESLPSPDGLPSLAFLSVSDAGIPRQKSLSCSSEPERFECQGAEASACKYSDDSCSPTSCNSLGEEPSESNSCREVFQSSKTASSDSQTKLVCVNRTSNTNASLHSDVIKADSSENYSTTALINVSCPDDDFVSTEDTNCRKSICVIEVTHEKSPVTFIHEDLKPMIVRETPVLADPPDEELLSLNLDLPNTDKVRRQNSQDESSSSIQGKRMPSKMEKSNSLPATKSKPPIAVPPSNEAKTPTSPSKQGSSGSQFKRVESKYLPRSYSSSETHLNTRRLLESQAATGGAAESCTRKSFSTDEVSKAWSQQTSPQIPLHSHHPASFSKDEPYMLTSPSELARCDSWSTSGLGSEISDGDSQQGDMHMMLLDDPHGPFDAVFADVYPGESSEVVFRDSFIKIGSSREAEPDGRCKSISDQKKGLKSSQKPPQRPASQTMCLKSQGSHKENFGGSTPRPISLPGVTGTYNIVGLKNNTEKSSSIDMGVELDDSPDWQSEKGHEIFKYEGAKCSAPPKPAVEEHMPVSSRTMGDDVKHAMTWFKIDPLPRSSAVASKRSSPEKGPHKTPQLSLAKPHQKGEQMQLSKSSKEKKLADRDSCKTKPEKASTKVTDTRGATRNQRPTAKDVASTENCSSRSTKPKVGSCSVCPRNASSGKVSEPLGKSASLTAKEDSKVLVSKSTPEKAATVGTLKALPSMDERMHLWDHEVKKKIRNIQRHVSLKSWDANPEERIMEASLPTPESSRVSGIHLAQELMQSMENLLESEIKDIKRQADFLRDRYGLGGGSNYKESREELVDPGLINVTFRPRVFRHHNQNPFSKNPNRASITLPINYSISEFSSSCRSKKDSCCKPLQDRTNWVESQGNRAMSEPPLHGDEGLYRVRSCPGLQAKTEDSPKDRSAKNLFCVTLRHRPSQCQKDAINRYSWTAQPGVIPQLTPPPFESCPDFSKLKSSLIDTGSATSGKTRTSPQSSSRLLPVS